MKWMSRPGDRAQSGGGTGLVAGEAGVLSASGHPMHPLWWTVGTVPLVSSGTGGGHHSQHAPAL
jgi:hypothetical protein